jgi:hypothetical protein
VMTRKAMQVKARGTHGLHKGWAWSSSTGGTILRQGEHLTLSGGQPILSNNEQTSQIVEIITTTKKNHKKSIQLKERKKKRKEERRKRKPSHELKCTWTQRGTIS